MGFIDTLFFKASDSIYFSNPISFGNLGISHLDLMTLFLDRQTFHLLGVKRNSSIFTAGIDTLNRVHMVLFADDSLRLGPIFSTSFPR